MNPTLPTYFLHILQGQRSNAQVLIFVFNSLRKAEFFIEFGRGSHNLGARKERLFLNYKVFPQNGRYHSSIQVTLQF